MRLNIKKLEKMTDINISSNKTIASTNTEARRLLSLGVSAPLLVLAEKQTGGRGRMGRSFYSGGHGIYMSFAYKTSSSLCNTVSVTTAAAVAVAQSLYECCEGDFEIKWVNDVYQSGKKVCGILTEAVSGVTEGESAVIIGVGINIGRCRFPSEIKDIAGSVKLKSRPEQLVAEIVNRLEKIIASPKDKSYMDYYREHFMLMGTRVSAVSEGRTVLGKVTGVDNDGALLLLCDGESLPIRIFSGEVTIRPAND